MENNKYLQCSKYLATWLQELLDNRIYGQRRANNEIFVLLLTNMGHFLILELGDYDYRVLLQTTDLIPVVLLSALSSLPRDCPRCRAAP